MYVYIHCSKKTDTRSFERKFNVLINYLAVIIRNLNYPKDQFLQAIFMILLPTSKSPFLYCANVLSNMKNIHLWRDFFSSFWLDHFWKYVSLRHHFVSMVSNLQNPYNFKTNQPFPSTDQYKERQDPSFIFIIQILSELMSYIHNQNCPQHEKARSCKNILLKP